MKLMQIFKETTTSSESKPGGVLGTMMKCFRHKLNIVLEGW